MTAVPGALPPRIVAFDLSLTASGVVTPDGHADTLKPPPKLKGGARLDWWLQTLNVILTDHQPDRIIIESPYVGHRNNTLKLGELYGVFAIAVHRHTPNAVTTWIAPSSLKKMFAGSGRADKDEMRAAAIVRQLDVTGLDDNSVDALALWTLATNGQLDKEPT